MSTDVTPHVVQTEEGDVQDIFFDVTLVISKDNTLLVVDNHTEDWKTVVDGNTLAVKQVKISIT